MDLEYPLFINLNQMPGPLFPVDLYASKRLLSFLLCIAGEEGEK
jgi:hypothetical protein